MASSVSSSSPHPCFVLFFFVFICLIYGSSAVNFGINYGQIADNLPPPSRVTTLLQSMGVNKVKLYDANHDILTAFANTNVEFIISITNGELQNMVNPSQAQSWIQQNIQPFIPQTKITCITVGNEVLGGEDASLVNSLFPAMQSVYSALVSLNLDKQIAVTTAHSLKILSISYPPSSGSFREDLSQFIQPILNFHTQTKSPFLINVYPFFAYKDDPNTVSLPYVLFEPNDGVVDNKTNLKYDNMLYAQIDSVYTAIQAMGFTGISVKVSETGWPSTGDSDELGATPENAATYNGNLMQRVAMGQGTPMNPSSPVDVYVFALFNENQKPGPASERNYGLFYPDESPVYHLQMSGADNSGNGVVRVASGAMALSIWNSVIVAAVMTAAVFEAFLLRR